MKKTNTYSALFYIRKEKQNNQGKVPIYLRITINGERAEISTKQWIEPNRWNQSGSIKGNKPDAELINKSLEFYRSKAWNTYMQLEERYEYVTAEMLKDHFYKQMVDRKRLIEVFADHNQKVKELIGKDYAFATYKRYETTLKHVKEFIKAKYNKEDIDLIEIQYSFIEDFDHYLKTHNNCSHNTSLKYLKIFRKVINIAVKNDWLIKDPFAKYKSKFNEIKRGFLTEEELNKLLKKDISNTRLDLVRDIFIFACYTGLAYVDVRKLTPSHIIKDEDGELWIITQRTKTNVESNIPLLLPSIQVIEKYKNYPDEVLKEKLLPILSNQKMNAYLKEIAVICDIEKNLTFHLARHTFATTVTLTNDVPIESVSQMLGHKNIRTTQIYAKIVDKKVGNDMKKLKIKLYES